MSQSISLWGATYSGVPSVLLPKSTSGTARFDDCSVVTAIASDVAQGKIFVASDGTITTGTASGGGGGDLEYEEGTYAPASDIAQPTISYTKSHSTYPSLIMLWDTTGSVPTNSSNCYWSFVSGYYGFDQAIKTSSSAYIYARVQYGYFSSSGSFTLNGANITSLTNSSATSDLGYWLTISAFEPTTGSSRRWRNGRSYKWLAVWKPTT